MQSERQNKKNNYLFLFTIACILLIIILSCIILIYFVVIDVPLQKKLSNKTNNENLLKLAESAYNNGYLENSAIYYKNYLETNPDKLSKIRAFEKLFEIYILNKQNDEAYKTLESWYIIDKNNPKILINKIKFLIRIDNLTMAKKEIDTNYNKFQNSTELNELVGIYFVKKNDFDSALKQFEKIPYNKREFSVNEKIIYCMLNKDKLDDCLKYINKVEPKLNWLELKDNKIRFYLLKTILMLKRGNLNSAYEGLKIVNHDYYKDNAYSQFTNKLYIYCNIVLDREEDIKNTISAYDLGNDPDLYRIIGDYFLYKNEYDLAKLNYEKVGELRNYIQEEAMALCDIYFHLNDYKKSIEFYDKVKNVFNYNTPNIYKNLSINYGKDGDKTNEFFFLKEGSSLFSDDTDFHVRIAKYYIDNNDFYSAVTFVNDLRTNNITYDKRLDVLYLIALENDKQKLQERELLDLREKNMTSPDYYFRIIKYYMTNKKYTDAYREIETLSKLELNDAQTENLTLYKLIYSVFSEDKKLYESAKKTLLLTKSQGIPSKINLAIINLLEDDYDKTLDILNTVDIYKENDRIKEKIFYLKSLAYLYKKDGPASYKYAQNVLELNNANSKAQYVKSIIKANMK